MVALMPQRLQLSLLWIKLIINLNQHWARLLNRVLVVMALTFKISNFVDKTFDVDSGDTVSLALAIYIYYHNLLLTSKQLYAIKELLALTFCSRELVLKLSL